MKAQATLLRAVPRLAITPDEAATSLGVSRSFFYAHILSDLRVIRVGRKRLISVRELERWIEQHAAYQFS